MGFFGLIITTLIVDAIILAIIYTIFNIIYNASSSIKGTSVFSFIVSLILFIVLLCTKDGPKCNNGEFDTGTVGFIAFMSIVLAFPVANVMVNAMDGDEVFQGIGQSIGILGVSMAISIIILMFSDTYWPITILSGVGVLSSVVTFIKD